MISFNGISTFIDYLMPKPSFKKNSSGTIQPIVGRIRRFILSPRLFVRKWTSWRDWSSNSFITILHFSDLTITPRGHPSPKGFLIICSFVIHNFCKGEEMSLFSFWDIARKCVLSSCHKVSWSKYKRFAFGLSQLGAMTDLCSNCYITYRALYSADLQICTSYMRTLHLFHIALIPFGKGMNPIILPPAMGE